MFPSGARIHCVGIGGIGTSALAKYLHLQGFALTGSDLVPNEASREVEQLGVPVQYGAPSATLPAGTTHLLYSAAVLPTQAERQAVAAENLPQHSYPEALGALTRGTDVIAVAGTHGKSTTTALLGLILGTSPRNPTVIVGTRSRLFSHGNLHLGRADRFVLEAGEYRSAFLHYTPNLLVLTRVEFDHPDAFENEAAIDDAFAKLVRRIPSGGTLVLNADDPRQKQFAKLRDDLTIIRYALADKINAEGPAGGVIRSEHYRGADRIAPPDGPRLHSGLLIHDLTHTEREQRFRVTWRSQELAETFILQVPGRHNAENAAAAIAAALSRNIPSTMVAEAIVSFPGIWRRQEYLGDWQGHPIISDYAHHPTEIRATLAAMRQWYPNRRIVAVFQPHHRARTKALFDQFTTSFADADALVVTEIYDVAGREKEEPYSSLPLAEAIKKPADVRFVEKLEQIPEKLVHLLRENSDVVVFLGAGDVDGFARALIASRP